MLLLVCQFAVTVADATLYTTTQELKVRRGAGNKFDTYYKLKKSDTVEILENNGLWMKIIYREKEGYVQSKFLKEIPEDNSIPEEAPLKDIDPYEDLDPKTLAGLIGAILLMAGCRKLFENYRKKKQAAVAADAPVVKAKPSYWFVCKNCNQKLRTTAKPSSAYCLKAPDHDWISLGQAGDNNYHCRHCGTTVLTTKQPTEKDCFAGVLHTWTDLGPIGTKHFYCRDCGITVMTKEEPTNINCSHAEAHRWAEL